MSNPYAPPSGSQRDGGRPEPGASGHSHDPASPSGPDDPPPGAGRTPPPTRPPASPPGRPATPAPTPEALASAHRQTTTFVLLLFAGMVVYRLPLPWGAAAIVFGVASVVLGTRALIATSMSGVRGPVMVVLIGGVVTASLLAMQFASTFLFWPLQVEYEQCRRDALTIAATEACEKQLEDGQLERLGVTPD